jgi:putative aminopeptidase FrvX
MMSLNSDLHSTRTDLLPDPLLHDAVSFLVGLLGTPSPTGFAHQAVACVENALRPVLAAPAFDGATVTRTRKGALLVSLPGAHDNAPPRAVTAHVDTLGAMVKAIKPNGRLQMAQIGSYAWTAIEYESVTVHTAAGGQVHGSVVPVNGSTHVNKDVPTMVRSEHNLEVRLDARTFSAAETHALGIAVGDFVSLEPRIVLSEAGFIRSRHLDDKLCAAAIYLAVRALAEAGLPPAHPTLLLFANYEEHGHGGAADLPPNLGDLLVVDMAAMGEGQASSELACTLCIKDGSGPYHHGFNAQLRALAAAHDIALHTDIYPYYSSDGSAYWRAGGAARVALIGPGVDSSHGYERGHRDGLRHTAHLIARYLLHPGDA